MESDFVRWLRARLPSRPWLRVGPGDDAAVLRLGEAIEAVVTCDLLADGRHFQLDRDEPRRIGRKAMAVNLSDLAAMASEPLAAFVSVALPRAGTRQLAEQLYDGMAALCDEYQFVIGGGDTNTWDGPLVISITLVGRAVTGQPLLRSGAKPGDKLLVTGQFGGSILGHHLDFQPRVRESLLLAERYRPHAGIDCSDGLSLDAWRLAEASGCGLVVDPESVPISEAALIMQQRDGQTALEHALSDGEDFELLLAAPTDTADQLLADQPLDDVAITCIGEFVAESGYWHVDGDGRIAVQPEGFEHRGDA